MVASAANAGAAVATRVRTAENDFIWQRNERKDDDHVQILGRLFMGFQHRDRVCGQRKHRALVDKFGTPDSFRTHESVYSLFLRTLSLATPSFTLMPCQRLLDDAIILGDMTFI